jgi:hypothetical protein
LFSFSKVAGFHINASSWLSGPAWKCGVDISVTNALKNDLYFVSFHSGVHLYPNQQLICLQNIRNFSTIQYVEMWSRHVGFSFFQFSLVLIGYNCISTRKMFYIC